MAFIKDLLDNAQTVAAGSAVDGLKAGTKTFQAWGLTDTGAGAATIQVQGTLNGGLSWDTIGTITLTLGTTVTSDSFTSTGAYEDFRGNVTAISGTGAKVWLRGACGNY